MLLSWKRDDYEPSHEMYYTHNPPYSFYALEPTLKDRLFAYWEPHQLSRTKEHGLFFSTITYTWYWSTKPRTCSILLLDEKCSTSAITVKVLNLVEQEALSPLQLLQLQLTGVPQDVVAV